MRNRAACYDKTEKLSWNPALFAASKIFAKKVA
jgi:hypothetical protein